MTGSPNDDVEEYLQALVAIARDLLGDDLRGAYAAGSVALGAYRPGRSDVDVALVCGLPLTLSMKQDLVDRLRHEALPCPARGLELVVYREEVTRSGTAEPGFELELNSGASMSFRATYDPADRAAGDGGFWYALDRSLLHDQGRTLLGPAAGEMFADLAPGDLHVSLVAALRWWLASSVPHSDEPASGAADAVLGACRALVRLRDGVWLSKVDAGRRVVAAGTGDTAVVEQAIAARSGGPPPSAERARSFQQAVLDELVAAR